MSETPAPQRPNLSKSRPAAAPERPRASANEIKWGAGLFLLAIAIMAVTTVTRSSRPDPLLNMPPSTERRLEVAQDRSDPAADRDRALLNEPNLGPQLVTFVTPQGERLLYRTRQYEVACLTMLTGRSTLAGPLWLLTRNADGWAKLDVSTATGLRTEFPPPTRAQQRAATTFNVCGQFRRLPAQTAEELQLDGVPLPSSELKPKPASDSDDTVGIGLDGKPTLGPTF
ncbi:hypothetical protein [Deinococcus soli (ex Cha et al. 2016)]|uniref:Uncharacterized protein n=2 Tax=Deinococcus soli (ex Cha et al. 2016) TaxID=1309411 RepID=A0AAE3XDP9_9DEIO|nr:hypothetical protein [Deinococcus soli (ex Cha et al. 2016)]MDR6219044.1 hypothetical protein [Deinococcus soli (ex Cha et al. 2016)]MDR6328841.1 hypothetical protein [Deinococcus soli (ex Cha et al. 2016)]MDR6751671.1 hypothetical protein [Deinococcus soli (ex Cha et al. 2016)]